AVLAAALIGRAAIVTPNAPEAERLTGLEVRDLGGQIDAAEKLVDEFGARAALIKGGHIDGDVIRDVLLTRDGYRVFESARIATRATHGPGCTLASAIATGLARGEVLEQAVENARAYLVEAIVHAPGFGGGCQPLGHNWPLASKANT